MMGPERWVQVYKFCKWDGQFGMGAGGKLCKWTEKWEEASFPN